MSKVGIGTHDEVKASFSGSYMGTYVSVTIPKDISVFTHTFREWLRQAGFDADHYFKGVRSRDIACRSFRDMEKARLVEKVAENRDSLHFQFTKEFFDTDINMKRYDPEVLIAFNKHSQRFTLASTGTTDLTDAMKLVAQVQEVYDNKSGRVYGTTIKSVFNRILQQEGLYVPQKTGIGFVPATQHNVVERVDKFLRQHILEARTLFIPVPDTDRLRQDVSESMVDAGLRDIESLLAELDMLESEASLTQSMSATRVLRLDQLMSTARAYETVCKVTLTQLTDGIQGARKKIETVLDNCDRIAKGL